MKIPIEKNGLSTIMSTIYSVIENDEATRQKVDLILKNELLTIQDGDLKPTNLTEKEQHLAIFKSYLDLIME